MSGRTLWGCRAARPALAICMERRLSGGRPLPWFVMAPLCIAITDFLCKDLYEILKNGAYTNNIRHLHQSFFVSYSTHPYIYVSVIILHVLAILIFGGGPLLMGVIWLRDNIWSSADDD